MKLFLGCILVAAMFAAIATDAFAHGFGRGAVVVRGRGAVVVGGGFNNFHGGFNRGVAVVGRRGAVVVGGGFNHFHGGFNRVVVNPGFSNFRGLRANSFIGGQFLHSGATVVGPGFVGGGFYGGGAAVVAPRGFIGAGGGYCW